MISKAEVQNDAELLVGFLSYLSADEIAEVLELHQIKGVKQSTIRCPLTNFAHLWINAFRISTTKDDLYIRIALDSPAFVRMSMPRTVSEFVERVDANEYPNLIE